MPSIARGQANTQYILNWFLTVGGVLTDAYAVEYRILDITGGLPGTQVFPTVAGTWEDVSSGDGHFATGSYYAYDNALADGWTPAAAEPIGTHRIEWRWKYIATSAYVSGFEDFDVKSSSSPDLYISLSDVRAEGLDSTVADDAKVMAAIELWQAIIERACRQWFNPRTLILKADGTDSDALHFGVPIIDIEYLKLNNSSDELDTGLYRVYNSRSYPDDRRNPRIKLIGSERADIYTAPLCSRLRFAKGRQNQEIKGTFGFTEEDGSTPLPIKRALLLLVIEKLTKPPYPGSSTTVTPPAIIGGIIEEQTDEHRIRYGGAASTTGKISDRRPGLSGITANQEILDIIKLYRAPIGIATPAHTSLQ